MDAAYQVYSIASGARLALHVYLLRCLMRVMPWLYSQKQVEQRKSVFIKIYTSLFYSVLLICYYIRDGWTDLSYFALGAFSTLLVIPCCYQHWSRRSLRLCWCDDYFLVRVLPAIKPENDQPRRWKFVITACVSSLLKEIISFGEATYWKANVNTSFDGEFE
jgi:hypothetical protein